MATITERVAKTQYNLMRCGNVVAWSKKVASTLIGKLTNGPSVHRIGIHEAAIVVENGYNVQLLVRHPLDRLVSNYVFWRTTQSGADIRKIFTQVKGVLPDEQVVELPDDLDSMTIEEWYALTQLKYNQHWEDQAKYHTHKGVFIPNILVPWEALATIDTRPTNPSPRTGTWEDYFTPEFREEMEARYIDDIALYIIAQETWDGKRPQYL